MDGRPMKSILKKTNSFSLHNFGQLPSPFSPYMTVTGAESRVRSAFHAIFQKSATLQDASPSQELEQEKSSSTNVVVASPTLPVPAIKKTVQLVRFRHISN
jgi:chloride channel 2